MKKKILVLIMAGVLMTGLTACGNADQSKPSETVTEEAAEAQTEESKTENATAETSEEEANDQKAETKVNIIMVLDGESVEIWNGLIDPLKEEGIDLITQFEYDWKSMDSILKEDFFPFDLVVSSTDIEGYSPIGYLASTPLNLYSTKYSSAEEIIAANANVGAPLLTLGSEPSIHMTKVLDSMGFITLKNESSEPISDAEKVYAEKEENVHFQGFDGNFPEEGDLEYFDTFLAFGSNEAYEPIATDPFIDDETAWVKLYCRTEHTKDPEKLDAYEKVLKAYQSDAVKELMNGTGYVPVGWDQDLISQYR